MPLESLSNHIYGQFFKFIQQKVLKISELPSFPPKSKRQAQSELAANPRPPSDAMTKHASVQDHLIKTNVLRETLRAGPGLAKHNAEGSLTGELYLLKQDTQDLLMLDFESKRFLKTSLAQKVPLQAKSLQVASGDIYVVGGFTRFGKTNELEVLRDCFKISPQMTLAPQ